MFTSVVIIIAYFVASSYQQDCYFRCLDGTCLEHYRRCDSVPDCPEAEDEINCSPHVDAICPPGEFTCDSGHCIDLSKRCDGYIDCSHDGSDEKDCECAEDEWQCDDGYCIDRSKHCDGRVDCPNDSSDEKNGCPRCPEGSTSCRDGIGCYRPEDRCDRYPQCRDGTDELNCECRSDEFTCDDRTCLPDTVRCNGRNDCSNGEDEQNCEGCKVNEFQCGSGECISRGYVCDEVSDCSDRSDEKNCPDNCQEGDFSCGDGQCVRDSRRCDGSRDCDNGYDEINCDYSCRDNEFKCNSGECIDLSFRCDGKHQCKDGSDESRCERPTEPPLPVVCQFNEFACHSGDQCVAKSELCDGKADCWDQTDEINCHGSPQIHLRTDPNNQTIKESREVVFQCRDEGPGRHPVRWIRGGGQPLPPHSRDNRGRLEIPNVQISHSGSYICEALGVPHNTPGASARVYLQVERLDEPPGPIGPYYPACGPNQGTCNNLQCIPKHKICDHNFDCTDGSDESRCGYMQCEPNEFRCDNLKCVRQSWVCDGDDDCRDGSDERDCNLPPNGPCNGTEFRCQSGNQCIPRSFHCDKSRDCQDGSDETGCYPATPIKPPPPIREHFIGDNFTIECECSGVPIPTVLFRRNWGHLPDKCITRSSNGIGTLYCPNVQISDQGDYTCECQNSLNMILVTPNTQLVVKPRGDICPRGTFNELAEAPQDCIRCFCFGASTHCSSATFYIHQMPSPLYSLRFITVARRGNAYVVTAESPRLAQYANRISDHVFNVRLPHQDNTDTCVYFMFPESYHQNQLKSYGGHIRYRASVESPSYQITDCPDLIITGNNHTLVYRHDSPISRNGVLDVSTRIMENSGWSLVRGGDLQSASREDIMMVLENVDNILLKIQYFWGPGHYVNIHNITMETAGVRQGETKASLIEHCTCPEGHTGLSCEQCEQGYHREVGPWLGRCTKAQPCLSGTFYDPRSHSCQPCPCPLSHPLSNQFSRTCHLDSRMEVVCDNCPIGYRGRRCEECEEGYTGNPMQPGDYCKKVPDEICNAAGSVSPYPDRDGYCECKANTEGQYCDRCKNNTFSLLSKNAEGCIYCFCMGITNQCTSSHLYRDQVRAAFYSDVQNFKLFLKDSNVTYTPYVDTNERALTYSDFEPKVYYWSLPEPFLGDKITSYGGVLEYKLRYVPTPGGQSSRNNAPDVELYSANRIHLTHHSDVTVQPDQEVTVTVPLLEQYWERSVDGGKSDRANFLMALADVSAIHIKATYTTHTQLASLSSVIMDTASDRNTGQERALEVEECQCPAGYTGTSCEDCAPGYTRQDDGVNLGTCDLCDCNGYSSQCDPDTGNCVNCRENRMGPNCESCAPGYRMVGDRCELKETDQCYHCDSRGVTACVFGRCQCKANVEGDRCDQCRPGTFHLTEDNVKGCHECYCFGATSDCSSSNYYFTPVPLPVLDHNHGFSLTDINRTESIGGGFELNFPMNEIGYLPTRNHAGKRLYWSLPSRVTGNKILSYGGTLTFTQNIVAPTSSSNTIKDYDVIIIGSGKTLGMSFAEPLDLSNRKQERTVKLIDGEEWVHIMPGTQYPTATRETMLQVLANVEAILVRATITPWTDSTHISDVTLDTSKPSRIGGRPALDIEVCTCPQGYKGTSCENCADGYYKDYSNRCEQCQCSGHEQSCSLNANYQMDCICQPGWYGDRCERRDNGGSDNGDTGDVTIIITIVPEDPRDRVYSVGETIRYQCLANSTLARPVRVSWNRADGRHTNGRLHDDGRGTLEIISAKESDSGTYICTADDGYKTQTKYVNIIIGGDREPYTPPQIRIVPDYVDVLEGEVIDIRCEATGYPTPDIQWRRIDNAEFNPNARRYNGIIRILNAEKTDEGIYECVAQNLAGTRNGTVSVYVRGSIIPVVSISPSSVQKNAGENMTLFCEVAPNTDHRFQWSREGNSLPYSAYERQNSLIVTGLTPSDSGVYLCTVINDRNGRRVGTGKSYVKVEPRIPHQRLTISPERQKIPQGETAILHCGPTSPGARITWSKAVRGDTSLPARAQVYGNELRLPHIQMTDRGIYVCEVTDYGTILKASAVVDVERREPPTLEIHPSNYTQLNVGTSVMVHCRALAGIPPPTITWFRRDNRPLPSHAYQGDRGELRLNNVRLSDSGEYICKAENSVGSVEGSTQIVVLAPPEITITPPGPTIGLIVGDRLILNCSATGVPSPSVNWVTDGVPDVVRFAASVGPSLTYQVKEILSVSREDEGTYTCVSSNSAGTREKAVHVIVDDNVIGPPPAPSPPPFDTGYEEFEVYTGDNSDVSCPIEHGGTSMWVRSDGRPFPSHVHDRDGVLHFRGITESDAGDYRCLRKNSRGTLVNVVIARIIVYPRPRVRLTPALQRVRPGSNPFIQCDAYGDPTARLEWYGADRELPAHATVSNGRLTFHGIRMDDAGRYTCRATSSRGLTAEGSADVLVSNIPDPYNGSVRLIGDKIQNKTEGDTVYLQCTSDYPDAEIRWSRERNELPINAVEENKLLRIDSVRAEDAGIYTCTAYLEGRAIASDKVELVVSRTQGIQLRIEPSIDVIRPGDTVDLKCINTGVIMTRPEWSGEGAHLLPNTRVIDNYLRIIDVTSDNAGIYRCQVWAHGLDQPVTAEYNLIVQDIPVYHEPSTHRPGGDLGGPDYPESTPHDDDFPMQGARTVTANVGESVELECDEGMEPPVSYEWTKRGTDTRIRGSRLEDGRLRFDSIRASDAGEYICRATNRQLSRDFPTVLVVRGTIPRFTQRSTSFIKLKAITDAFNKFTVDILFKPELPNGLILYNGQKDDGTGDFVSFGLQSGYPEFRFDMGSGSAVITADNPVTLGEWVRVRLEKDRKLGSLQVNDGRKQTGSSPGRYQGLDLEQPLYLGSVPDFKKIQRSTGFDTGFVGCISRLAISGIERELPESPTVEWTNMSLCDTCAESRCRNGAICQETPNMRGYTCICPKGMSGNDCERNGQACAEGICGEGRCEDLGDSIRCHCSFGTEGHRCERKVHVRIPSFNGNSYLGFPEIFDDDGFKIEMDVKPDDTSDSLLLYAGQNPDGTGNFISLVILNGGYELRVDSDSGPIVLRSDRRVEPGQWSNILLNMDSNEVALTVNGRTTTKSVRSRADTTLNINSIMYVGGHSNWTIHPSVRVRDGFRGCVKGIRVNAFFHDMKRVRVAENVGQCAGYSDKLDFERGPCPDRPCEHGGRCIQDHDQLSGECHCSNRNYTGTYCDLLLNRCDRPENPCGPHGICVKDETSPNQFKCQCLIGFKGAYCTGISLLKTDVKFNGDGYMELPASLLPDENEVSIEMNIKTDQTNGLILWHGQSPEEDGRGRDFFSVAIVNGQVEVAYDLGGSPFALRHPDRVDDNLLHTVHLKRSGQETYLTVDNTTKHGAAPGLPSSLNANGNIYLGGLPKMDFMTGGRYSESYSGCIIKMKVQGSQTPLDLAAIEVFTINVEGCPSDNDVDDDDDDNKNEYEEYR